MTEAIILSTERLVLRPWQTSDVGAPYEWAQDERFTRFLPLPRPYDRLHAEEFTESRVGTDWAVAPAFAVTLEGVLIGDVNARVDAGHGRAEMGYGFRVERWGQGYATEAARAVLDWLFEAMAMEKVMARADAANQGSWRVMERLGMEREATHRSHRVLRGERRDEVVYGLLRRDWLRTASAAMGSPEGRAKTNERTSQRPAE
ncbi:MAG: GNAT family N-acetyltransferase [Dehalococcoidia bacterium]